MNNRKKQRNAKDKLPTQTNQNKVAKVVEEQETQQRPHANSNISSNSGGIMSNSLSNLVTSQDSELLEKAARNG